MTKRQILDQVKQAVRNVEPGAEIVLFGSRARGDASPESDWDFLVLVDGDVDSARTDRIWDQVYDVELASGEVLSVIVRSRAQWNEFPYRAMPIHQRITAEGVRL